MRLRFLGGADEVGASCLLVETASARFLVDCGLRMGAASRRDPLPDLAPLDEVGPLDAVLVTHAHLDHTGALPLIHGLHPDVPVLATAATRDLMEILLADAAKIQGQRCEQDEALPIYPPGACESLLARIRTVPFLETAPLGPDHGLTFFPAGHVLGAACIGLESPEGHLLVTGDFSVDPQRSIPGLMSPRFRPDVLVSEATYGGRHHAVRALEEERLVATVAEGLRGGGKVLVPAFALGRAQEVILILAEALRKGQMPPVPVYVDGMVRPICGVYAAHGELLRPAPRKKAAKGQSPFFHREEIVEIRRPQEREAVLTGGPCVVIASSGMLSGGPSAYYAAELLGDERNRICITGYQDEEAPGRQLLAAADGETTSLAVGGRQVELRAKITRYTLSAHADAGQIAAVCGALGAKELVFVHGDDGARAAIARAAAGLKVRELHLPRLGESLSFPYRRGHRGGRGKGETTRPSPRGIAAGRPLDDRGLEELWLHLVQREGTGRIHTLGSLLDAWHGREGWGPSERQALDERLREGKAGFEADVKRPFLYRLVDPAEAPAGDGAPGAAGALDLQSLLDAARAAFAGDEDFLRCGQDPEGALVLTFAFPDVARSRHDESMARLAGELGVPVKLHPEANLQALEGQVLAHLPEGLRLSRALSVHRESQKVTATVEGLDELPPDERDEIAWAFRQRTGFALALVAPRRPVAAKGGSVKVDGAGRMEINAAYARIREIFADACHRPAKMGQKTEGKDAFIELGFLTPEVGRREEARIARAEGDTGWVLRVGARVDQQSLIRMAREAVADLGGIAKGPSVHLAERRVELRMATPVDGEQADALGRAFVDATGFALVVAPRVGEHPA